ncbi:formylglycine-generating enzyme family protein, partial [Rahnella aquatilis]
MNVKKFCAISAAFLFLSGCDNSEKIEPAKKNDPAELDVYLNKIKSELIYIKGGEFLMGDY